MRWGFLPAWVKNPSEISLLASARAESLSARPAFAAAYRYRRCLLPATGFYLWQRNRRGDHRLFLVKPVAGGPIGLAGLWETWSGADGSEIDTACLITIAAEDGISAISARSPVIIAPADFDEWLSSPDRVEALLRPAGASTLSAQPVDPQLAATGKDDSHPVGSRDAA
jgi:putative SOS response-associated peptidase YedK